MSEKLLRTVSAGETKITYTLELKPVKNINLRVRTDGSVRVSASNRVKISQIDDFVISKADFILKAIRRFESMPKYALDDEEPFLTDKERKAREKLINERCRKVFGEVLDRLYPAFIPYGVRMPELRIRRMKNCWGSCLVKKGVITLNRKLIAAPEECIEYVVMHELCHFVHPDHSVRFYELLEKLMPDWKARRLLLERGSADGHI